MAMEEERAYTIDISVAASDATPAIKVVVAANFWPVPPAIFHTSLR